MTPPSPPTLAAQPFSALKTWPPAPQSVGRVRQLLAEHLVAWGLPELVDSAELVLSELFTNALTHAHSPYGGEITTRFGRLPSSVLIEVYDSGDGKPELREAPEDGVSGRGLFLVDVLTGGQWGVSDRDGSGKCVWALCALKTADCIPGRAGKDLEEILGSSDLPGTERRRGK